MKSKFGIIATFLVIAMFMCALIGCPNRGGQAGPKELKGAVSFSSTKSFTIKTINGQKNWGTTINNEPVQGKVEYSLDNKTWIEWDGKIIEANAPSIGPDDADNERYYLYLRGEGNTHLTTEIQPYERFFVMTSTDNTNDIILNGNMKDLLDYKESNFNNIIIDDNCFTGLFYNCKPIKTLGNKFELPFTTLSVACYSYMFMGCSNLTSVPASLLPAETMKMNCYMGMFYECKSLTTIPASLPATTLATSCYSNMFNGCKSLESIPSNFFPSSTLAQDCCNNMFCGCTSLTTLPASLPATTLTTRCYSNMFNGCTKLSTIPADFLPATTLAPSCYSRMFYGCTSLKISNTQSEPEGYTIPLTIPAFDEALNSTQNMFDNGVQLTGVNVSPTPGTYYVHN